MYTLLKNVCRRGIVDSHIFDSGQDLNAHPRSTPVPPVGAEGLGLSEIDRSNSKSLATSVFTAIRQGIVDGQLEAGHRYFENEIATELGVSRTPVREAVRSLAAQGIVLLTDGRRGFVIIDPRQDVSVVYEIRKRLEGLAARRAADHITVPQLQRLETLLEEMLAIIDADDIEASRERLAELNDAFHSGVNEASESTRLIGLIEQLEPIYISRRLVTFYSPETLRNSHASHQEILQALWARDGELAERLIHGHINHGQHFMLGDNAE
jgi:DNA-binding GntR family transcriptional regulator